MDNIDRKLQQIAKIRPLQQYCIGYRSSLAEYRKIVKKTYASDCRNLVNVEMTLDEVKLKLPETQNKPPSNDLNISTKADYLSKQTIAVQDALELM